MQIYGILLNIHGILLNIRGILLKNRENQRNSFLNTPILCSKTYYLQILLKFLAFFLAVSNILLTFANAYKTIVNYPARRPLSPMASSRRLFLCLGKSFFLTGKIIFSNWENRYAQYMAAA